MCNVTSQHHPCVFAYACMLRSNVVWAVWGELLLIGKHPYVADYACMLHSDVHQ